MDKINSHYDHLHDHLLIGSSSSSSSSAPNPTLMNSSEYRFSSSGEAISSKENDSSSTASTTANEVFHRAVMAQDLGFQWTDHHLSNVVSENYHRTFTDMLVSRNSPSVIGEDLHLRPLSSHMTVKNNDLSAELSQKLMLKTLSSSSRIDGALHGFLVPGKDDLCFSTRRGLGTNFNQIHPSINISSPSNYQPSCATTSSLDCRNNWPTFDLLSNGRIRENDMNTPGTSHFGSLLQESLIPDLGLYRMKQANHRPEISSFDRMSVFSPTALEAKRPNSSMSEGKASQVAPKKTRFESRSTSCPPMKVRKEKLGDRIAALQQLVAPFGKTDTASVLMEAIGYIKFLQNQVQTLSVPYMKASRNNTIRNSERVSRNESEEANQDLRSRGLCLVPLSCMSYITNDGGAGASNIWPPQDFSGGI